MLIKFQVEIDVERVSGKFASKDDIAEAIAAELESAAEQADVSGHDTDGTSEYEVTSVNVERV